MIDFENWTRAGARRPAKTTQPRGGVIRLSARLSADPQPGAGSLRGIPTSKYPQPSSRRAFLVLGYVLEPVPRQKVDVGWLAADLELLSSADLRGVVETAVDELIDEALDNGGATCASASGAGDRRQGTPSYRSGWHRESPDPELWRSP
jgi:hypothetical protein